MRDVILYGHLRTNFGHTFRLNVGSPAEAIAALSANLQGFANYLRKHSAPGYKILIGNKLMQGEKELNLISRDAPIRIVPVVAGASGAGMQIVFGAVLVVAGWAIAGFSAFTPLGGIGFAVGGALSKIGMAMAAGGVINMLTGPPSTSGNRERPETAASYTFNGSVNTTAQGNPVPIAYGEVRVGSQVISAGVRTDDMYLATNQSYTAPNNSGNGWGRTIDSAVDQVMYEQ